MKHLERDDTHLYKDVLAYLQRFSALDDHQWAVVAHYVFLTYIHDHPDIDYCPYILFYAVPERGKSRTGKSVSYIAFRGIHLIEMREPNIFRYSQNLHGTLFFDLMDVWKKAERKECEDILLGRYEKGAKCSRILHPEKGAFNDTVYYDIYGPTLIASNEMLHKILDTRCLPIIMPNKPGSYENPRPELGLLLKERLTAWRAKMMQSRLEDIIPPVNITGRLWDITKPLFQVAGLSNSGQFLDLYEAIDIISTDRGEAKRDSIEGIIVSIIHDLSEERGLPVCVEWTLKVRDILDGYNKGRAQDKHVTPQWIGRKLKSLSLKHRNVNGRSEILLNFEEYRTLIGQYGFSSSGTALTPETLPDKTEAKQADMSEVESEGFVRNPWNESEFIKSLTCEEEEIFNERVAILIADGRLMPEDAKEEAYNRIMRRWEGNE
jgi:hypothetical protein